MRTGLIVEKVGMTRIIDDAGRHVPVTVLKLDACQVVSVKTVEKHGYTAVQLGSHAAKTKNVSKPLRGHFSKSKVEPKRYLQEFRVSEDAVLAPGDELQADHFIPGQSIDAYAWSKGKGFAGVMKRHNFGGLRASHGVSLAHRSHGSTGQCQDPGRVFPGKKMAGQLGNERVTIQNLSVQGVDNERGLIFVHGAIPGPKGGVVYITDAKKKSAPTDVPFPGSIKKSQSTEAQSEVASADVSSSKEGSDEN